METSHARSNVQEDAWLVGEHLLLNAKDWTVHLVVNVGQVTGGGTLSHTAELIVDGTVTEANPTFVSSQVGNRDATQMSANSRAAKH